MNELLKRDSTLKIISVLAAILIWIYVVDVQNPEIEITYRSVPVSFVNRESLAEFGLSIVDEITPTIDVRVRGRRKVLSDVKNSDIRATADLIGYNRAGDFFVPVQVQVPDSSVLVIDKKPYTVPIKLDKIIQVQKAVNVNPIGKLSDSYMASEPVVTPNMVVLEGPAVILNTVDRVCVDVNLEDVNDDIIVKPKIKLFNKDGEEIVDHNIKKDVEVVEVRYKVMKVKTVPVMPNLTGEFSVLDAAMEKTEVIPSNIKIAGEKEIIDNITQIATQAVDLSQITDSTELDIPVIIPDGVHAVDNVSSVKVKIEVKRQAEQNVSMNNDSLQKNFSSSTDTENMAPNE